MKVSLKLGGHVIFDEQGLLKIELVRSYAETLRNLWSMGHKIHVVVGGGPPARLIIAGARSVGCPEPICDEIGIEVSRINARILQALLSDLAYPSIPKTYEELKTSLSAEKMVICGGLYPGQSTTAVAALLAELIKADALIVATDVDGVYTEDPKRSPNAKKLEELSYSDLQSLLSRSSYEAGGYKLFDYVALKVAERSKLTSYIIDGRDPNNLLRLLEGVKVGSRIHP